MFTIKIEFNADSAEQVHDLADVVRQVAPFIVDNVEVIVDEAEVSDAFTKTYRCPTCWSGPFVEGIVCDGFLGGNYHSAAMVTLTLISSTREW